MPLLLQTAMPRGPLGAVWKVVLDREVTVKVTATGRVESVDVLYAGPGRSAQLLIPAGQQPTSYRMLAERLSPDGEDGTREVVDVPVKHGFVTVFEAVPIP